jgi:hypothetical protein
VSCVAAAAAACHACCQAAVHIVPAHAATVLLFVSIPASKRTARHSLSLKQPLLALQKVDSWCWCCCYSCAVVAGAGAKAVKLVLVLPAPVAVAAAAAAQLCCVSPSCLPPGRLPPASCGLPPQLTAQQHAAHHTTAQHGTGHHRAQRNLGIE